MQKASVLTLGEIATRVQGELIGDPKKTITGICPLDEPEPNAIAYCGRSNVRKIPLEGLGAVFIAADAKINERLSGINIIKVKDPYAALVSLIPDFIQQATLPAEISAKADIAPSAKIGERTHIGAFSVIGDNVVVGSECVIHPHVVIYPGVTIGDRCTIHAGAILREGVKLGSDIVIQNGAIIGADGFGYVPDPQIGLRAIPQVGTVHLHDRVEVGANSCIDRATLGLTTIGWGTKMDNLVQVGHNTKIGKLSILCGHTAVAGSCAIGDQVVLGGNVGVADHITIASNARFSAKSGVNESILEAGDYGGHPPVPLSAHRRNQVVGKRIAETIKELKEGIKKLDD